MKEPVASSSSHVAATDSRASRQHHHPYRLEVHGVTPISISLLCSLRPLPLSAIPRSVSQGRTPVKGAADESAKAIAKAQSGDPSRNAAPTAGGSGSVGVATRTINRKATKAPGRGAAGLLGRTRAGKSTFPSNAVRRDSTDWPSDDGATAVEDNDEEEEDGGEVDDEEAAANSIGAGGEDQSGIPAYQPTSMPGIASLAKGVRALESGLSVCVNGVPWGQVVVGDNGSAEASVIIHGLQPARDYDVQLMIDDKQSSTISVRTKTTTMTTTTTAEDDKQPSQVSAAASHSQGASASTMVDSEDVMPPSPAHASSSRLVRAHTPPMQDTEMEQTTAEGGADVASTDHVGAIASAAPMSATEIQTAIRKARKEASRAESALRNEIEAIKRGLDRMSDVDHRSKQKVLALQESIRQATTQARDIDEEATAVESERETWEGQEREKEEELAKTRAEVEEKIRTHQQRIKSDREEVESMEKKLEQVVKSIEEKMTAKEKLEKDKIVELEQRLSQMQAEIESALARPVYPFQATVQPSGYLQQGPIYNAHTTANRGAGRFAATRGAPPTAPRGRGVHHYGTQAARGGAYQNRGQGRFYGPHQPDVEESGQVYGMAGQHLGANAGHQLSILNPQNPEFVPAGVGGLHAGHPAEQSPITKTNRYPFPPYLQDQSGSRRASASYIDVQHPGANPPTSIAPGTDSAAAAAAAAAAPSWITPGSMSPWAPSNVTLAGSPQLGQDIWRSPVLANVLPSLPSPQNQLRQKTSMPFGLRASNVEPFNRNTAFLYPNDNSPAGKHGSSAPVSPSQPQENGNRSTFAAALP